MPFPLALLYMWYEWGKGLKILTHVLDILSYWLYGQQTVISETDMHDAHINYKHGEFIFKTVFSP